MLENHTFFKNEDGVLYGVSPRVMDMGYSPSDGHTEATQEEKDDFIQQAADRVSVEQSKTLREQQTLALDLKDKGLFPSSIKQFLGIDIGEIPEQDLIEIERLRTKQATQKAAKEAVAAAKLVEKQRLIEEAEEERLAAIEAEKKAETERQAAFLAEEQAAREVLRQAAIEAERQAEAERLAIIEAEKKAFIEAERQAEAEKQAIINAEAEKQAAEEAEKQDKIDKINAFKAFKAQLASMTSPKLNHAADVEVQTTPEKDEEGGTH